MITSEQHENNRKTIFNGFPLSKEARECWERTLALQPELPSVSAAWEWPQLAMT